ncbi:hypothetical protein [Carboxylicivirga sp. RSCT41]|uniref:hypothetical protein n=1 Tax=Carboxylicivirga agarovorans TaxID=3417570 RepID=UPI003D332BB0
MRHLVLITLLVISGALASAQCINYARNAGKDLLGDYIHDGNYNGAVLEEGEKAELYKTFFSGQSYRVGISKVAQLPDIHLRILDKAGNVLFDNADYDYRLVWDFKVESTQMLVVELNVLERDGEHEDLVSGCVAVLFGLEPDKKKKKK